MKKIIILLNVGLAPLAFSQVGINTPNPQGSFHVDGGKDNPASRVPDANQSLNDVIVTSTGNVGVGTVAPVNKLHVVAATAAQGAYNLFDAPGGVGLNGTGILRLRNTALAADGNIAAIGFSNNGPTSGGPGWQVGSIRTRADINTGDDFYFSSTNGATQVERFRINSLNGNIGIATADPTERLDVVGGNVRIREISTNTGNTTDRLVVADTNGILKTVPPVIDTNTNIYNADGTITGGNRTVAMGTNNLIFNSTTGNFQINGNTDGLIRGFLRNLNTGVNSRTDFNIAAGTGNVYLGLDKGSGIFGAGAKGYLDNRSGGRLVIANNGNEQMTVDNTTGNVGVGSISPRDRLSVVDADNSHQFSGIASFLPNNLTQGVGIGWTGVSSIGSIDNISLNLNGKGTGHIVMQSNATGNVGIGATPTAKLDVNGNARIRTINSTVGNSIDKIVAADASGLLKVVTDIPRRTAYATAAIAPNASHSITVTDPAFTFAQINVTAGNACTRTMITTFAKNGNTLNYLGGQARDITGGFSQLNADGNYLSVKFPYVLACADGGNGTQFDFDILINGNIITITNKGNIAKSYSVRVISNL